MPPDVEVTLPNPPTLSVSTKLAAFANVAVTAFDPDFDETTQVPVPAHAPDQPVNVLPLAGVAVNVTEEPPYVVLLNTAEQTAPQFIRTKLPADVPEAFDATVPDPVPLLVTLRA